MLLKLGADVVELGVWVGGERPAGVRSVRLARGDVDGGRGAGTGVEDVEWARVSVHGLLLLLVILTLEGSARELLVRLLDPAELDAVELGGAIVLVRVVPLGKPAEGGLDLGGGCGGSQTQVGVVVAGLVVVRHVSG